MIYKEEIDEKAAEFEIHSSNVQRDYIFGWLLAGIYTASALKDHFVLKGGNCFRKAYFQNTRYSADLDFSVKTQLRDDFIKAELNKVCDFISDQAGIVFEKEKNLVRQTMSIDRDRTVHEARIYFKDFYGKESQILIRVKLDITQFDRIYLPIQERHIIHPYSDQQDCNALIRCVKVEELLASKLKCLLQRRQSSDLYDYVHALLFQLQGLDINRNEVVQAFLKMTIFERSPGAVRGLLIDLPFNALKAYWNKYLVCPKSSIIDADKAIETFKANINELFGKFSGWGQEWAFFPSEFRNVIMDAGENQTLLSLTYDGVTRKIEPYSLAFKTRQDGISREYFYGYDRTGGRSSGPGIKTFVQDKIQQLENTNEPFQPQFDIELAKSVERTNTGYFARPFSKSKSPFKSFKTKRRSYTKRSSTGPKYIYQCPVCNKRFTRSKYDPKLNAHKDKYGNQCYGRHGHLVETKYS